MKSINIRSLKHETSELLERVALGESVEIRRRNEAIAVIKPLQKKGDYTRPNFRNRIQTIYGGTTLEQTATELLNNERGKR
jgi:antitoxin (DNA-binding transcriptional repressor) of toxin-antitoxin stability system